MEDCEVFLSFLKENFLDKASPNYLLQSSGLPELNLNEFDLDELCRSTTMLLGRGRAGLGPGAGSESVLKRKGVKGVDGIIAAAPMGCTNEQDESTTPGVGLPKPVLLAAIYVYPIKSCAGTYIFSITSVVFLFVVPSSPHFITNFLASKI
jgi:hypothetical protein